MICMTVLSEPHRSFFVCFFVSHKKYTQATQKYLQKVLPKEEYFIVKIYCVFTKLFIYLHNTILLKNINETS
jgi:hypothetical protein